MVTSASIAVMLTRLLNALEQSASMSEFLALCTAHALNYVIPVRFSRRHIDLGLPHLAADLLQPRPQLSHSGRTPAAMSCLSVMPTQTCLPRFPQRGERGLSGELTPNKSAENASASSTILRQKAAAPPLNYSPSSMSLQMVGWGCTKR